ncbi:MAG: hypothetical protein ACLSAP_00130 [Oscillospiraceae bacterium]
MSVHKKDCPNANLEMVDKSQAGALGESALGEEHWAEDTFKSTLQLLSNGRQGVWPT